MRAGAARGERMGDACGQHARLAGAGTRQHEHGAIHGLDCRALLGVQDAQIIDAAGRCGLRLRAGGEPTLPGAIGQILVVARAARGGFMVIETERI